MHYDHFHRCCPAKMPERFTSFQKLPAEIRLIIWEFSLPDPRVYEVLDAPNAKQRTPAKQGLMFANVHPEPPPALAAVCGESRHFVLTHYKPLMLGPTTKYVDLSRDILLLEPYLLVKRLHRTLQFMSQIPLVRDNISCLALGTSYGLYTGICHPVLSWKVAKTNMGKLLAALAKFTRLKTLVLVVHQEFQFEFDFRFPGGGLEGLQHPLIVPPTTHPAHPHSGLSAPLMPAPAGTGPNNASPGSGYSRSGPSPNPQRSHPSPPPYTHAHMHTPHATTMLPRFSPPGPAPAPHSQQQPPHHLPQQHVPQHLPQHLPRPQLVHQAYRFKFDIEANINHTPRRPHFNELLYYPLDIDEDKDDWDLNDPAGGAGCG
jgi:hypothetical protein